MLGWPSQREIEIDEYSMHGRNEHAYRILIGKLKVREHLGKEGVNGRILLKLILGGKIRLERCGLDLTGSG
jgi:hypothetical protein